VFRRCRLESTQQRAPLASGNRLPRMRTHLHAALWWRGEGVDTACWRVRALSFWAYVLLFGALFGWVTFGVSAFASPATGTRDHGLVFVWIAAALVGLMAPCAP
jgi:hypothetical protein